MFDLILGFSFEKENHNFKKAQFYYITCLKQKKKSFFYTYIQFFFRSNSEGQGPPTLFTPEPGLTAKAPDPSQLGVVAGPFGQMLQAKEQQSSQRGSQYSIGSNSGYKDGKL